MDIIERAARALCWNHNGRDHDCHRACLSSGRCMGEGAVIQAEIADVKTVLSALREPDEGMIEAYYKKEQDLQIDGLPNGLDATVAW